MAFHDLETSNDRGQPIFLYEFILNDKSWRYATSAQDKLVAGNIYVGCQISDDGIKQAGDASTDTLTITAPSTIGPARAFLGTPPSSTMYVRIRHMHEGDSEAPLMYFGEVLQISYAAPDTVSVMCLPLSALMEREGLRLTWQRTCPYALYDPVTCKVDKSAYALEATIREAANGIVKAPEFAEVPSGRLNGGFLEWIDPMRGRELRTIEEHVGDTVRMFGLSDGLYYGLKVTAYPGCDLRMTTCHEVFNNLDNYGGAPFMPGKSPFDGTPVF